MHNKQHLQIKNNNLSKIAVVILSIALITGIFFVPLLQTGVYAQQLPQLQQSQQLQQQQPPPQQPQQQQQNRVGLSQVIRQIAQQVATANPGTNETKCSTNISK